MNSDSSLLPRALSWLVHTWPGHYMSAYRTQRSLNFITIESSTYLHLNVNIIIEFFIEKLEQTFVLEVGAIVRLAQN